MNSTHILNIRQCKLVNIRLPAVGGLDQRQHQAAAAKEILKWPTSCTSDARQEGADTLIGKIDTLAKSHPQKPHKKGPLFVPVERKTKPMSQTKTAMIAASALIFTLASCTKDNSTPP